MLHNRFLKKNLDISFVMNFTISVLLENDSIKNSEKKRSIVKVSIRLCGELGDNI